MIEDLQILLPTERQQEMGLGQVNLTSKSVAGHGAAQICVDDLGPNHSFEAAFAFAGWLIGKGHCHRTR